MSLALPQISRLPPQQGAIVVRGVTEDDDPAAVESFGKQLRMATGCDLVIFLLPGQTIETYSESKMRAAGWVKMTEAVILPGVVDAVEAVVQKEGESSG